MCVVLQCLLRKESEQQCLYFIYEIHHEPTYYNVTKMALHAKVVAVVCKTSYGNHVVYFIILRVFVDEHFPLYYFNHLRHFVEHPRQTECHVCLAYSRNNTKKQKKTRKENYRKSSFSAYQCVIVIDDAERCIHHVCHHNRKNIFHSQSRSLSTSSSDVGIKEKFQR